MKSDYNGNYSGMASGKSVLYQFQIKDEIKAARIEAPRRTDQYVEVPKTSQR